MKERRSRCREDVAGVIEQHRADSRKYRLVHNTLQNLIVIFSAATTTVVALDTGSKLTWQNVTIVAIGLTVTLSAAFTGYCKHRERSQFLLQTADTLEAPTPSPSASAPTRTSARTRSSRHWRPTAEFAATPAGRVRPGRAPTAAAGR